MEIKELITFKTITEEGTFSLAAKKLNYAQSTVTTHIQKLEKELGFLLFERGWDASLTVEGRLFIEEAENLLHHVDFAISQAQRISREEIGVVHIGLSESIAEKLMPAILNYLHNEKPFLHCEFIVGNTAMLAQLLSQNKLDFAVCGKNTQLPAYQFIPISEEEIVFIVNHPAHPLLKKDKIDIADIIEFPVIIGENSCYYHHSVNDLLSNKNLSFQTTYSCSALHLIPNMLFGDAIGILPKGINLKSSNIPLSVQGFNQKMPIGFLLSSKQNQYLSQTKQEIMKIIAHIYKHEDIIQYENYPN